MAYITYPEGAGSKLDIFQWRKMRAAEVPDQIKSGLAVTAAGGLVVRLAPGQADVGGFQFINTANQDFAVDANTSGATKIWRLVLRLTITADSTLAGGAATILPLLREGAPPTGVGLIQNADPVSGVLQWEVPLARFAVTPSVQAVDFLTNDGPGLGAAAWAKDNYQFPNNIDTGFPDLTAANKSAAGSYGPQPASVSGMDFAITVPGIYAIKYGVQLLEAETALAAPAKPYIRLKLPDGDAWAGFQLGVNTEARHGRAVINETLYLPSGFNVEPRMYQNTGATQATAYRFRIVRLGVL